MNMPIRTWRMANLKTPDLSWEMELSSDRALYDFFFFENGNSIRKKKQETTVSHEFF